MRKAIALCLVLAIAFIYAVAQPDINSVSDSPDPVEVPGSNNITADITGATSVYVEIYYPDGSLKGNYSMTNIPPNTWYYNDSYAYPDPLGVYNYTVKAYNASGWNISSTYNFTLQDTMLPSSSVDAISTYWHSSALSITATATDNYHVENVSLWYRYSTDNSTWGAWTFFSKDLASPWQWNFNFPAGEGYYRFYSIANDSAGNTELPPGLDEDAGHDITPPSSSVDPMAYWYTSLPVVITASASDTLSGVKEVSLYYRYSSNNATWSPWAFFGTDTASPWQWNFNAPFGDGYYEFYTIAEDNAGNSEAPPVSADENAGVDTNPPTTSISPSSGSYVSPSSSITLSATDTMTGVSSTYYRIWNGTWHPAPGTGTGKSNNFYVYSGAFSLVKAGTNYVEYYSEDNIGNEETTHNASYTVESTPPSISNIVANPSTQSPGGYVNISCTVTDSGSGVDGVYLEVTYPDSSKANFTMHYISCTTYYRREVYTIPGLYSFTIYARDNAGNGAKSSVHYFTITGANNPPYTPSKPSGVTSGYAGVSYTYTSVTTDPDGDQIYYYFDWGDSTTSGWVGPYTSGCVGSASHAWTCSGTYYVKVKAKDVHGAESGWSSILTVAIGPTNDAPVTTYTLNPSSPDGKNGWYLGSVEVTLTATDPDGDAIAYTKYRIDGGSWITYTAPFTISSDGEHILEFYSVDDKGSTEATKSATIKIDTSKPYLVIQRPMPGYLYLFDRQIWPLASGNTVIIGRILVRTTAYDMHSDIENVSFYVNGILQNIDTMYPYEWLWRGDVGYMYLHAVAYNKAGLMEETPPMLVYIFSL